MSLADDFRRRARYEARRYGGDEWIFVRELLQNSRDAGAGRIDLKVERHGGVDRVVCTDDGCGMSFEHARRFLFTLYASSKGNRRNAAGRFGIGFWAVLRFAPDEVRVRSVPAGGKPWQLRFSGDLERIEVLRTDLEVGTEIELIRRSRGPDPLEQVHRAIRRDARHLRRLDAPREIVDVRVNSVPVTGDIKLDPPRLDVRGKGFLGAVAMASRPQVDLLAHGLRVRTTATLDELLTGPDRPKKSRFTPPEGLLPRVILDSRRLQVLLARGDARTDGELERLVTAGRRGLKRLVREQLDREAGLGRIGRALMRVRETLSTRWGRIVTAVLMAGLLGVIVGRGWIAFPTGLKGGGALTSLSNAARSSIASAGDVLRTGAAARYGGPTVTRLGPRPDAPKLNYRPRGSEPLLAVFNIVSMDDDGRVVGPAVAPPATRYLGPECRADCLDLILEVDGLGEETRLPVPTGHMVDPGTVEVDGKPVVMLWRASDGGAVVDLSGAGPHRVAYRTGPAPAAPIRRPVAWPTLPSEAEEFARSLKEMAPSRAAETARRWVHTRVVYDTSDDVLHRHTAAVRAGLGFAERCLAIGAGDCDVQNALLAALLHRAGVPVRLAVGFVGIDGRAQPGLHAWVEFRSEDGRWGGVDASRVVGGEPVPEAGVGSRLSGVLRIGVESDVFELGSLSRIAPLLLTAVLLAVGVIALSTALRRRAVIGDIQWRSGQDLGGMLRGALARPDAFADVPLLFSRKVVRLLGGESINLDRARELCRRGLLAVGSGESELARNARAAGCAVIDGSREEGEAVAGVLGATDLRRWQAMVDRGTDHPLFDQLQKEAATVGEDWRIVLADGVDDLAVLDGPRAGRRRGRRVVVVDPEGMCWQRLARVFDRAPQAAVLLLAERTSRESRQGSTALRRLLSRVAARALFEREERCG